jgi:uncharacterized membrane protein YqgA involved in biofilm formation
MAVIVLIGMIIWREGDIYTTVAFSAILLLVVSPHMLFNIGFQLSYTATLSLVLLGKPVKMLLKTSFIPEKLKDTITHATGLAVIFIGISGTLQGIFKINSKGALDRQYIMTMVLSLVIGGLIGELIDIERILEKIGLKLEKKFAGGKTGFAEGFVNATLLFCVGAMAIVGSMEDGLTGNTSTLFAKSILDGITSVVLASTFGIGVMFSALSIGIYQGSITLLSGLLKPFLMEDVISQMSLVGSVLIAAVGTNMLGITKIKVANLLPAIFIPLLYFIALKLLFV